MKAAIKGLYSLTYGDGDICASKSLIPLVEESCGKRFGMQYRRACEMMQLSLMTVPNLFSLEVTQGVLGAYAFVRGSSSALNFLEPSRCNDV